MKIEFTKEVIDGLITMFGVDKAIDELVSTVRVALVKSIEEIEPEIKEDVETSC